MTSKEYDLLLQMKQRELERVSKEAGNWRRWIYDLLGDDDSTLMLNIGGYAGKLIGALSAKIELEREVYDLKDFGGYLTEEKEEN